MPILETGNRRVRRRAQTGMSLVEVMVVVVILALVASVVIMSLPEEPPSAEEEALRFAARLKAVQETSILQGRVYGLDVEETSYQFLSLEDGQWYPYQLPVSRTDLFEMPEGVAVQFTPLFEELTAGTAGGDRGFFSTGIASRSEPPLIPELRFDPTGQVAPAEVSFASAQGIWQVTLAASGAIAVGAER